MLIPIAGATSPRILFFPDGAPAFEGGSSGQQYAVGNNRSSGRETARWTLTVASIRTILSIHESTKLAVGVAMGQFRRTFLLKQFVPARRVAAAIGDEGDLGTRNSRSISTFS